MRRPMSTSAHLAVFAAVVTTGACAAGRDAATPPTPRTGALAPTGRVPAASPSWPLPPIPAASPSRVPARATSSTPAGVPQEAAWRLGPVAPGSAHSRPAPTASALDYAGAQAVAEGYVRTRLTFRFDDPAGYTAALTSPAFTTAAFAARSKPSAAALAQLVSSQETSAAVILGALPEVEAPSTTSTRYVVVTCTVTTTYRGGRDSRAADGGLRLRRVAPARWRVDGVLSST